MIKISDAQCVKLVSLLKTVGPSADDHKVDQFEVKNNIEGEQETLTDHKGPLQIEDVLNTVGEVLMMVKDKTDVKYQR
jgi:hypothetical protein